MTTLTTRALNRALLARQMLLAREPIDPLTAIERLAGMQAQLARPPFFGLHTRLDGFRREQLLELIHSRKVVRATMMRGTIHLVSTADYIAFRGTLQPLLTGAVRTIAKAHKAEINEDDIAVIAGRLFTLRPQTFEEFREALVAERPGINDRAAGYVARMVIPLVMAADETDFGYGPSVFTTAEAWLGRPIDMEDRSEQIVLRYLAAFGPASVRDAQSWSGMTKLAAAFEKLRPRLVAFRDEKKRELFDLPDAPRPSEDTPAPVRLLPAYDNIVLAHADRTRILPEEHRPLIATKNLLIPPTILVDGFVAGTWQMERNKISITPFGRISRQLQSQLKEEAARLEALA